ncbi:hypothetical protein V3Q77_08250 [Flavobacterium davisii]|uniref:Uncharacterized protein n=1 Tax=Flavobacterium davisii TaxID=2906077 RepID=A0ABW8PPH8_9FLAO
MTPKQELEKIIFDLGVSKVKIAEILGLSYNTLSKMLLDNQPRHNVNVGHVEKVKAYYKALVSKM